MYCTVDGLVARFGQQELVDLTNPGQSQVDAAKAQKAIDDATATINGYLGGRYTLPLSTVPAVLVRLCADLARYYLYDNAPSEVVSANKVDALAFLKSLAKGDVTLGVETSTPAVQPDDAIEIQSSELVFSRRNSKGFI
ncbi:gp436 family protein [Bowmanella denitrificans]|uniref:gp436 family protein n=1 Tax=Bowmanella denitrificans TaxID=366582 RepID=UPI000C99B6BB|nr:phage protein Gp36 family protein [Bowmanella denitrificans]